MFSDLDDDTEGMNPTIRLFIFLLLGVAVSLPAQDSNRWTFFQTLDWEARLAFLQDQVEVQSDGEFLLKVLDLADTDRIESGADMEITNKKNLAILVIRLLADHPVPGAVAAVSRIPRQYRDPVLRGEAWITLAKLGDQPSVPGLVRTLASMNDSGSRGRAEEIQAAYLVQALGILKASEAFRTVAAASLAWYSPSSGVKTQARRTMAALVPDVEKATLVLLADDEDLALREGLFLAIVDQGDASATARAASAVLGTLVRLQANDKENQDRTERLTLASLLAAQKTSSPPASLVPPLRVLLTRAQNQESMVQSVRLLGKIDDPTALTLLSQTLSGYNAQQKMGTNKGEDLAMVKELFLALANTGKVAARIPLDEARFSDYTPALAREALDALDKLPDE